ncbi:hypothetical protein ACHQM5_019671 [Ranunculus cassubicifolius]
MGRKRMKALKIYEDKISELPDDILYIIVSFLTMKEAAKTGSLSRRWKLLWMKCVASSLTHNVDVLTMITNPDPRFYSGDCLASKFLASYVSDRRTFRLTKRRNFAGLVYQILHLDHSSVKDSFSVRFYLKKDTVENIDQLTDMASALTKDFAHNIDKWIKMAVSKRYQNPVIDMSHFFIQGEIYGNRNHKYSFPCLFPAREAKPTVKFMGLKRCSVRPLVSCRFSSLIDIKLRNVTLNNEIIPGILSYCHDLEKISLSWCEGLLHLKIPGPSLKLKHLTVLFCWGLEKIEVHAKNLKRLQFSGFWIEFIPIDVPNLSEVIFRNECQLPLNVLGYARGKLSSDVPQLEYLMLTVTPVEEKKITRRLISFANLKKLVLLATTFGGALWGFIPLLQASPYLRNFQLHQDIRDYNDEEQGVMEKPCDFPLLHLEEITLSGFVGRPHDIEFMTYLLNNAPSLKKLTIFCKFLYHVHEPDNCGLDEKATEEVKSLAAKGSYICKRTEKTVFGQLRNLQRPGIEILFT